MHADWVDRQQRPGHRIEPGGAHQGVDVVLPRGRAHAGVVHLDDGRRPNVDERDVLASRCPDRARPASPRAVSRWRARVDARTGAPHSRGGPRVGADARSAGVGCPTDPGTAHRRRTRASCSRPSPAAAACAPRPGPPRRKPRSPPGSPRRSVARAAQGPSWSRHRGRRAPRLGIPASRPGTTPARRAWGRSGPARQARPRRMSSSRPKTRSADSRNPLCSTSLVTQARMPGTAAAVASDSSASTYMSS